MTKKLDEKEFDLDEFDDDFDEEEDFDFDDDETEFDETYDSFTTNLNNQSEVHKIWLDTEHYLNNIFLSITNQKLKKIKKVINSKETYITKIVPIHDDLKPLANELGISQIMAELRIYLSTPLVQGNLDADRYNKFLYWYGKEITVMLYSNRIKWGINVNDVRGIYNKILGSIGIYLTRPINNLERLREKARPDVAQDEKRGIFNKFRERKRKSIYGD